MKVQVKSITSAGVVTNVGPSVARSAMGQGTTAVDEAGTTWVPHLFVFSQPDAWGVFLVTASGQVTEFDGRAGADLSTVDAVRTPDGMRVWAHGVGSFRVEGTALVLDGPEPVLLRDAQLVLRTSTTSYDGGAHLGSRAPGRQRRPRAARHDEPARRTADRRSLRCTPVSRRSASCARLRERRIDGRGLRRLVGDHDRRPRRRPAG